jgi:hypothetical protein
MEDQTMAMTDWSMKGTEFTACNCDFGCPCQFMALPTHGTCMATVAMQIESGHFDATRLDGLRWISTLAWPKAIHEGNGRCQVFIDEAADEAQRQALLTILSGQETAPGATIFQVFSGTITEMLDPCFVPIELQVDIAARTGHAFVPGVLESRGEPIVNPITGEPHRARVSLPEGFEYSEAEYGSSNINANGGVPMHTEQCHAHFCHIHMTQNGVVH